MNLAHAGAPEYGDGLTVDDEAIAALARWDRQAFAELYLRHRDALVGYARSRSGSDEEATELAAVTFERALASIHRYRPSGAGFRAWLFRIARNAAIDEQRRRARHRGGWFGRGDGAAAVAVPEPADPRPGPDQTALVLDEQRRLRAAVAALPDLQREVVGLRFGAGLTAREIGQVIGKRDAATQKLIERAIARLREDMA